MGLDMYLTAENYFWSFVEEEKQKANQVSDIIGFKGIYETKGIKLEVGYWRKANQIHAWFVKNIQDGEDECKPHHLTYDKMRELKALCQELLKNKDPEEAARRLPTESGFFFGGTEINEFYWDDLEDTVKIFEKIEDYLPEDKWSLTYQSSW